jgi:hypothetical protein
VSRVSPWLKICRYGPDSVQFKDRLLSFGGDNASVPVGCATNDHVPAASNAYFE